MAYGFFPTAAARAPPAPLWVPRSSNAGGGAMSSPPETISTAPRTTRRLSMERAALVLFALVAGAVLLPGAAMAGSHEGLPNPLDKQVVLYLDGAGALANAPPAAALVPAGPAGIDGTSAPVLWEVPATKNSRLASAVYVDFYLVAQEASLVAGGPEGAALKVELAKNGEPVEGAMGLFRLGSTLLQPGEEHRVKLFLPQVEAAFAPGDALGLRVSYYGLNPAERPAIAYKVGGETESRLGLNLRLASMDELDVPAEVGPWPVAPLGEFDFQAAARKDPSAKVFTLRAFQFGFQGAPVVVPNGTKVVLQLYVDESLSGNAEGHDAHGGHGAMAGDPAVPWDQSPVTALHGFSLAGLDPRLQTVLFDSLVVTLTFQADKPGDYTFMCTVFCGTGHGTMLDRLTVLPPPEAEALEATQQEPGPKQVPGPEVAVLASVVLVAALLARRRA